MAAGIEVFNAAGGSEFNTGSRLTRFLTTFIVDRNAGSIHIPGLNTGEPHAIVVPRDNQQTSFLPPVGPKISFDQGSQIATWPATSSPYAYQWSVTVLVF